MKKKSVVIGLVAALGIAASLALFFRTHSALSDPREVFSQFMEAVRNNDVRRAYHLSSAPEQWEWGVERDRQRFLHELEEARRTFHRISRLGRMKTEGGDVVTDPLSYAREESDRRRRKGRKMKNLYLMAEAFEAREVPIGTVVFVYFAERDAPIKDAWRVHGAELYGKIYTLQGRW